MYFHFHNNHTQLAKMSFDKIFDLTAEAYFIVVIMPGMHHGGVSKHLTNNQVT